MMNSRHRLIAEPGDEQWLHVTPRAAAAGGTLVALLFVAMILFAPDKRPNVDTDRTARPNAPPLPPVASATSLTPASGAQASLREHRREGLRRTP
jgi:hypothetical protein